MGRCGQIQTASDPQNTTHAAPPTLSSLFVFNLVKDYYISNYTGAIGMAEDLEIQH